MRLSVSPSAVSHVVVGCIAPLCEWMLPEPLDTSFSSIQFPVLLSEAAIDRGQTRLFLISVPLVAWIAVM